MRSDQELWVSDQKQKTRFALHTLKLLRFVHMDSESASQEAIRNLNGKHDFHGRKMKVGWVIIVLVNIGAENKLNWCFKG